MEVRCICDMFRSEEASDFDDGSADAGLEQRRARAVRARESRQKAKANEQRLLQKLKATIQDIDRLTAEKNTMMQRMRMLEETIQQYKGNKSESSLEQHGANTGQSISESYETYCQENFCQSEENTCDTPQTQSLTYCDANYPCSSSNAYEVTPTASHSTLLSLPPFTLLPPHHDPLVEGGGQSYPAHGSPSFSKAGRTAVKVYELPPQENPATEAKRLRALKAYKKRQQDKEVNRNLELHIQLTRAEIQKLQHEKEERKLRIETLEKEIADLNIN